MKKRRGIVGWLFVAVVGAMLSLIVPGIGHASEPYVAKGLFTIDAPEGFRWVLLRAAEVDGVTVRTYTCVKPNSHVRITLSVEDHQLASDDERIRAVKNHFSTVFRAMKQGGHTGLKGQRPSIEPPIPDSVPFFIWGSTMQKAPFFMRSSTLFTSRVYVFQVYANSKAEVDRYFYLIGTLQDTPSDPSVSTKPIRR